MGIMDNLPKEKDIDALCDHRMHANAAGTWRCSAVCTKCSWRGVFKLTKGHELGTSRACPNCGNSFCLISQGDPAMMEPRL